MSMNTSMPARTSSSSARANSRWRSWYRSCIRDSTEALHRSMASLFGLSDGTIVRTRAARSNPRHRCAAVASSRIDRFNAISRGLARAPRQGFGVADHGARLPLSLPVVQPRSIWQNAPAPKASFGRRRTGMVDRIATNPTWRGWPTMSSPFTTAGFFSTPPNSSGAGLKLPFECISRADRLESSSCRNARRNGLFPRLDRLRERLAADPRCHGAGRHR